MNFINVIKSGLVEIILLFLRELICGLKFIFSVEVCFSLIVIMLMVVFVIVVGNFLFLLIIYFNYGYLFCIFFIFLIVNFGFLDLFVGLLVGFFVVVRDVYCYYGIG